MQRRARSFARDLKGPGPVGKPQRYQIRTSQETRPVGKYKGEKMFRKDVLRSLLQEFGDGDGDAVQAADKEQQKNQDDEVIVAEESKEQNEAKDEEKDADQEKIESKDEDTAEKETLKEDEKAPEKEEKDVKDVKADDTGLEEDQAAGSQKWKKCETHNAHKCVDMKHCCCNVGTTYNRKKQMCIKNPGGDKDPEVVIRQIQHSRRASFGSCDSERGMHPCGTGCCCNGELEYNVDSKICEDSPAITGASASDTAMSDPAPPKEDPIPGSQTWIQTGATCESKEAYGCGVGRAHCCCRFGCEFIENWDSCGRCKNEVPKVKENMIPASQLWESRVKKGICNARSSHPCGAGCCCNAAFTWSKEQRRCLSTMNGPLQASAMATASSPAPAPDAGPADKKSGSHTAGLAMFTLLLPLVWVTRFG